MSSFDVADDSPRPKRKQSGWDRIRTCGGFAPSAVIKTAADSTEDTTQQEVMDSGQQSVALSVALSLQDDAELRAVVEAWADLPAAVRAGIVAMVSAATGTIGDDG